MQYLHLRSLFGSGKKSISLQAKTDSFRNCHDDQTVFIEPTIEKIFFENEKPSIILISAVGATGKTTLARRLSSETNLPLLDLGTHKPVGDNSLTGLITESFPIADVSNVLQGLNDGTFGMIIDGIDEGRTKTTEEAFEAFLDNLVNLCRQSNRPVFVILGRTVILDDCWMYLTEANVDTALVTIEPFSVDAAKQYIDAFAQAGESNYADEYRNTRDKIINILGAAFTTKKSDENSEFVAFMGYPPVLDSIVTLLKEEKNYHKLTQALQGADGKDVETSLLLEISKYILDRDKDEKIIPNVVQPMIADILPNVANSVIGKAFDISEQCERLVAYCLGRDSAVNPFGDRHLDEQYNERLLTWIPEHPFLSNSNFRNAVFEAFALSVLMNSDKSSHLELAKEYLSSHKSSYHLIYILDAISSRNKIDRECIKYVVDSAMEFRSVHTTVYIDVDGPSWEDVNEDDVEAMLEINVALLFGGENGENVPKNFEFVSTCTMETVLILGPKLAGTSITVPCDVVVHSDAEVELVAPVFLSARRLQFDSTQLVLRSPKNVQRDAGVMADCRMLSSTLRGIITGGVSLEFYVENTANISYPIIQYIKSRTPTPTDPLLGQKYLRLKRILLEFRSHGRGALARYRAKIDSQRVLKNDTGNRVLARLLADGIVSTRGDFYYINADRLHEFLGVSWQELRVGQMPDKMRNYLVEL